MTLLQSPHVRLFVGAILISFSPVFVNLVSVSPTTVGFYRVLIGGTALALFMLMTGRRLSFSTGLWAVLLATSVFFALDLWFWHRSIVYIGPGIATLLANLQVFFMMAASALLLRQRPTALQLIAVPLAVLGLAIIVAPQWNGDNPNYRLGVLFGMLTAMSYAGYMLCMRKARIGSTHAVPMREVATVSMLVVVILGVTAMVEGESLKVTTLSDAGWLLAYGLLCHAAGTMFIASSLVSVTATEVGLALLLQPALSYLWDILFFARPVALLELAGALLTLFAIFLGSRRGAKEPVS